MKTMIRIRANEFYNGFAACNNYTSEVVEYEEALLPWLTLSCGYINLKRHPLLSENYLMRKTEVRHNRSSAPKT